MRWLRHHYGAGPIHLIALLACWATALYAVTRVFDESGGKGIVLWFALCLVLHDVIGWPIYALADRVLVRTARPDGRAHLQPRVPWINHVRVPTVLSGLLLVMFGPLILRLSDPAYQAATGFNENVYLINWLFVTAVFFLGSAVIYLTRLALARRVMARGAGPGNESSRAAATPR